MTLQREVYHRYEDTIDDAQYRIRKLEAQLEQPHSLSFIKDMILVEKAFIYSLRQTTAKIKETA